MTNDVSIVTKNTLRRSIIKYSAAALIVLGIGVGVYGGNDYLERKALNKGYSQRITKVKEAIHLKDYDLARILVTDYEKNKLIKPTDISEFRLEIERKEKNSKFQELTSKVEKAIEKKDYPLARVITYEYEKDNLLKSTEIAEFRLRIKRGENAEKFIKLIHEYDFENASKLLSELNALGIYSPEDIRGFEKRISDIKPENMKELWIKSLRELTTKFQKNEDLETTTKLIKGLSRDIEKYGIRTDISKIILEEKLIEAAKEYVKQKEEFPYSESSTDQKDIEIGDKVKFTRASSNWKAGYVNDRSVNFPTGSIGDVIDKYQEDWIIEFDKNKTYSWQKEWEVTPYWKKRGHQGIARFEAGELTVLKLISPSEMREFQVEFEKLMENYKKFLR